MHCNKKKEEPKKEVKKETVKPEQKSADKKAASFRRFKTKEEAEAHKTANGGEVIEYTTKSKKQAYAWKAK